MFLKLLFGLFTVSLAVSHEEFSYATTQTPEAKNCTPALECIPSQCVLPDCLCSGGETSVEETQRPQIIYLTYDDAFSEYSEENYYRSLFDGSFKNPNGCNIRATHFLTAQYTDYTLVNKYWKMGHEMASHSITHRTNIDYWKGLNVDGWSKEIEGMRKMISQFAAIPKEEVQGFRAPFLQIGGDEMFTALERDGFSYDCSMPSRKFGYLDLDVGLYPYSLKFHTIQDCEIEPCPSCSYEKLWAQPMLDLEDLWIGADPNHPNNGMPCSMLDGCIIIEDNPTKDSVKRMLMNNFLRNRNGTRAPMGLYMHAGWFYGANSWHYEGYKEFIREVMDTYGDVWFVTVSEGIDYVKNYNSLSHADLLALPTTDGPFGCPTLREERLNAVNCEPLAPCRFPNVTNEDIFQQERYMHICGRRPDGQRQACPKEDRYPWLEDPCGGNLPCL